MSTEDLEIKAMGHIASSLESLDDDAKMRVIEWAAKRYGVKLAQTKGRTGSGLRGESGSDGNGENGIDSDREFAVFADLFDAATPKTEPERALVGGYWFQEVEGQQDFAGQQVNDALKNAGHGIGNITVALGSLQSKKPALVRQVSKAGRSRQARKKYKLTTAGVSAVHLMMSGGNEDGE
jgi:hypothetical protein